MDFMRLGDINTYLLARFINVGDKNPIKIYSRLVRAMSLSTTLIRVNMVIWHYLAGNKFKISVTKKGLTYQND